MIAKTPALNEESFDVEEYEKKFEECKVVAE